MEFGNGRVFPLLWDFPLAPDEGGESVGLQQDGPVLLKVRVSAVPREARLAPVLSRLPLPSSLWQSPPPWARSRGHSRLVAAAVSSVWWDRECRI